VECDVQIVYSPIRYGSGDYEDPPEIENDQEIDTYYIEYGSTTARGEFKTGGGGCSSLEEAMDAVQRAPGIGSSVRWTD
jgi:hypothetical protein